MTVIFDPSKHAAQGPVAASAAMDDIEIAGLLFRGCAEDLARLQLRLQAGELAEVKDAVKAARELRSATQLILEERKKLDKLRKEISGGVGDGVLDLDAARDEIGRRLACLRRAAGG